MKIKQIIKLSGDSEKVTNDAVCEGKTGFSRPNIKFLFDIVLHWKVLVPLLRQTYITYPSITALSGLIIHIIIAVIKKSVKVTFNDMFPCYSTRNNQK